MKLAKRQLCLRVLERPAGQNPRPAMISPSFPRLLWFDPTVVPAAMFDWPITREAIRKELLWCCSWAGNTRLFRTSQQETWSVPEDGVYQPGPVLKVRVVPRTKRTALTRRRCGIPAR
jgi:hypothetical protein